MDYINLQSGRAALSPFSGALVPVNGPPQALDDPDWETILEIPNGQVVLYHPASHALAVQTPRPSDRLRSLPPASSASPGPPSTAQHPPSSPAAPQTCPTCHRPLPPTQQRRKSPRETNYFHLLSQANSAAASRAGTPAPSEGGTDGEEDTDAGNRADGYYERFFVEEKKLGRGAWGGVYLCQHVLDGNFLGHYAVKKIAVGTSHEYLLNTLKEVRLLETLRHPNIVDYHHSWVENSRLSAFGPAVPVLYVLMSYANGGSLAQLVKARQGFHPTSSLEGDVIASPSDQTREERIAAAKAARRGRRASEHAGAGGGRRSPRNSAVHYLRPDEMLGLFEDVATGLGFLHSKGILHLDLKPANVLLQWDDDDLIPRAMLSDFGSALSAHTNAHERSGASGTLEYVAPETLEVDPRTGRLCEYTTKSDMWSLGMILFEMCFFRLPYDDVDDIDRLTNNIRGYRGFDAAARHAARVSRPNLPVEFLHLLSSLLSLNPVERPSTDRILSAIEQARNEVRFNEVAATEAVALVPRRPSDTPHILFDPSRKTVPGVPPSPSLKPLTVSHALPPPPAPAPHLATRRTSIPRAKAAIAMVPGYHRAREVLHRRRRRGTSARDIQLLKTVCAILKLYTLFRSCPGDTLPRAPQTYLVFAFALLDFWLPGIWASVALLGVHLGVLLWPISRRCAL